MSEDQLTTQLALAARLIDAIAFDSVSQDATILEPQRITTVVTIIVDELAKALEAYLRSAPPLPSHVVADNHRRLEDHLCRCLGLRADVPPLTVLDDALRRKVSELAERFYYDLPYVRARLEKAAVHNQAQELDHVQKLLRRVKQLLGFHQLQLSESLKGGLSGSLVIRVYFQEKDSSLRLGVFKYTDDKADFDRERAGHRDACASWMKHWIGDQMHSATVLDKEGLAESYILLSPLAFPPTAQSQIIPSLHDLITNRSRSRSKEIVDEIGKAFAEWFATLEPSYCTRKQFFDSVLAHWPKIASEHIWQDQVFWTIANLPSPDTKCFQDGTAILWNPIWLANHGSLRGSAEIDVRRCAQHGDLNARNVMVPIESTPDNQTHLRLIDFEKWTTQSAVLDPCWLSFFVLAACAPLQPTREHWQDLPLQFVNAVLGDKGTAQPDAGAFQLGLDLVACLFEPLHRLAASSGDVIPNTLRNMLTTTLAATALASSYYATRELDKAPFVEQKLDDRRYRRLWAIFGFRVAARCLDAVEGGSREGVVSANVSEMLTSIFAD